MENYISNDEIIGRIIWCLCRKAVRTNAIYYYRCNPESTTKGINKDFYKILRNERILMSIINENNIKHTYVYIHQIYMLRFLIQRYIQDKHKISNKNDWLDEMSVHLLWCEKFFIKLPINWKRRYIKMFFSFDG